MKITRYEIDVLDVGAADAIIIHVFDDVKNLEYLILIDAERYEDGIKVVNFIKRYYRGLDIDLAFCTHCDDDHYGGFVYMLERQQKRSWLKPRKKRMVVNDPGLHVDVDNIRRYRSQENAEKEARTVYTLKNGMNLLEELLKAGVPYQEGFSDKNSFFLDGHLKIVGPTTKYYESIVYDLRNKLQQIEDDGDTEDAVICEDSVTVYSKTLENTGDDSSANNQSSIMLLFMPDDEETYFFMGDAGRDAFYNMSISNKLLVKDVDWLKVPHHGSKYNLNSDMINYIHPSVAYVSAEKYGKYLSKAVVNALNKVGCRVYGTLGIGSLCYHIGTKDKEGYSTAEEI